MGGTLAVEIFKMRIVSYQKCAQTAPRLVKVVDLLPNPPPVKNSGAKEGEPLRTNSAVKNWQNFVDILKTGS